MKLDEKIEDRIKKESLRHLGHRPNWDVGHVMNAVHWMKILIKGEGGNERVLLPAIYLHDSGYPRLKEGYSFEDSVIAKKDHAEVGAKMARKFLPSLSYFTEDEIGEITYLIANHSKSEHTDNLHRQLVYESDRLSQIDFRKVNPNFDKKNCIEWFEKYWKKRKQFMKTKTGIEKLKKLEDRAIRYMDNWPKER